jgi:hypothetical protein
MHAASKAIRLSAKPAQCPAPDWVPFASRAACAAVAAIPPHLRTVDAGTREPRAINEAEQERAENLVIRRAAVAAAITGETAMALRLPFQHRGVSFPHDAAKLAAYQAAAGALTYPVQLPGLDGGLVLVDEAEARAWAAAGLAACARRYAAGDARIAEARAASTAAGVDAA